MTSELEQEFYDTFGIEPEKTQQVVGNGVFFNVIEDEYYPEITAEKLLEMICILNLTNGTNYTAYRSKNISDLKEEILEECMKLSGDIELKPEIQQLFKEQ